MPLQIDELKQQIESLDLTTVTDLAAAWKSAKTYQDHYNPSKPEFKLLEHFKSKVLKQIRKDRRGKSIEELDDELHNQVT